MKIVFLLTHIPNPRMNKRLLATSECANVDVICIRRRNQDLYEPLQTRINHIILDINLPSSNSIFRRYLSSQCFKKEALEYLEKLNPDIIYTEGLDSLIIANKYKKKHSNVALCFEVADIREIYLVKARSIVKGVLKKLIVSEERKNLRSVDCLVITSMMFYKTHFYKFIDKEKVLFMPNVPDIHVFSEYEEKEKRVFTVGFIGGIRYLEQMKMLADAAGSIGCNVLFAGAGGTKKDYLQITGYCKGKRYVCFTGRYSYNDDIAKLYGMVNCVYAVYDADNPNVRIALPNKLYEAVYCGLPIIVAKGTYLAEIVMEWGVGVAVSHKDKDELINEIIRLRDDSEYFQRLVENCMKQRKRIFSQNYNELLKKRIKEISEKKKK